MLLSTRTIFALLATLTAIPSIPAIPISSEDIAALETLDFRGQLERIPSSRDESMFTAHDILGDLSEFTKRQEGESGGSGSCVGSGCPSQTSDPSSSTSGNNTDDGGECLSCS